MRTAIIRRRLLSLLLSLVLSLTCTSEALAAEKSATAATMQLAKTEGTVEVSNSSGKKVTLLKNMRLRSGYRIATEEASYAWTNLDSTKLAKLDAVSEMSIRKSGKKLELLLDAGNLFFNVTEPLVEDESLNIRTSTMIVGIRGTSGWVKVIDQWTSEVCILEGTVTVSVTDPVTGDVETATVRGGESATCVVYPKEHAGRKCEIIRQTVTASATPGFVQVELPSGDPMREPDPKARLEQDQKEVHKQLEEIKTKLEAQDHNVSTAPVWANPEADKPAASNGGGSSSRPSGGNGGADVPTPPQPSGLMMPQTDNALNALLGQNSSISVQANPALDARGNTLAVDSGLTVPAGKTLTLQFGIAVDVLGGQTMQVDGTMTVGGNVTNSGHISVASPNTLRVQGSLTNRRSLSVSATGHIVVDGMFVQQGAVTLTEGALVRARGFSMGVEIPDWKVSDEPDGAGYYVLVYSPEEPEIFAITFDPGDGTEPIVLETDADGKLPALPMPNDREGYMFDGWFTADGKPVTTDTVFTEDMEIHAQWTENEPEPEIFTVTLDPGDGTEPIILETGADGKLPALPTPDEREGFTFEGWFTADGKPVTTDTVFTEDMEIHAQWTENEPEPEIYTVTLDPGDGTEPIILETDAEGKLPALPTPGEREGYTFEGWFTADGTPVTTDTVFTEDMEIHAQWTEKIYTITFDANGGSVRPSSSETGADGTLSSLPTPSREGYTFDGWFTANGTRVTTKTVFRQNSTVYARWTKISAPPAEEEKIYTVTFDAAGGAVNPGSAVTGTDGKLSSLPTPTQDGYIFMGWYIQSEDEPSITVDHVYTADTTLHARWLRDSYTVVFDANGGTITVGGLTVVGHSATVTPGGMLTEWYVPNLREGYVFDGWFTEKDGGTKITEETVPQENITLYAHWHIGGDNWSYDPGTKTLRVWGNGRMYDDIFPNGSLWDSYRTQIEQFVVEDGIIQVNPFQMDNNYYPQLHSVTLADSVLELSAPGFSGCANLAGINIPAGFTQIEQMVLRGTALTAVTIPAGVTSIGQTAFNSCKKLESVTIPKSMTLIDEYAFDGCDSLTDVHYGGTKEEWKALVPNIRDYNDPLLSATIHCTDGDIVPNTGAYAITFDARGGKVSTDSSTPSDTITIDTMNGKLSSLPTPTRTIRGTESMSFTGWFMKDGTKVDESTAFTEDCTVSAYWAVDWEYDGAGALTIVGDGDMSDYTSDTQSWKAYQTAIISVDVADTVTSIGNYAFYGCSSLADVTISTSVTRIGGSAFNTCDKLTNIILPDSITNIGSSAFRWCSNLSSITIPQGVSSIDFLAFEGCSKLASVTIPNSVISIGNSVFSNCGALTDVYYTGTEGQWQAINGITVANVPDTATIHYNSSMRSAVSNSAPGYTDVPSDAWYAEAAAYCLETGLMNGTSDTTFSPDAPLTRAMMVTVLHRLAGTPAATETAAFPDVPANKWYAEAVSWASGEKIVLGYPDGSFKANAPVTREQAALIFQRYSGDPNMEIIGADAPKSPATRAEIAVTLMNYAKSYDSNASAMDVMVSPSGIALDADGSLLVTDVYNKQVWRVRARSSTAYAGGQTVLDLYGQPLGGYNDAGLDGSYFKEPWAIAPFLDGWAVSDTANNVVRLIRGDATHTLNGVTNEKLTVTEIGVAFNHPTGLTSDDYGNLYVSDTFSGSIRKITPKGGVSTVAKNLSEPTGLCWKNGVLYVAETGKDRIVRIQDSKVSVIASGFDAPQGVAVGDDGCVYVSDTGNGAVRMVRGNKVTTIAARDIASMDAGLTSPVGLLVQGGSLYVCDTFARKVFVYQIG